MGTSVNSDKNWTIMPKKRSDYDLNTNETLKQRKKQLQVDIIILVLIILITFFLSTIAYRSIKGMFNNESFFLQTYEKIISNNVFDSLFDDKKDDLKDEDKGKTSSKVGSSDSTNIEDSEESGQSQEEHHSQEEHEEDVDTDEYFVLSSRDTTHTENMPFDELLVPGDFDTKKYAVEVKHKEAVKVYFSLDNVTPSNDPVLNIIKIDVSVNGNNKYSGTLNNFINNHVEYSINSAQSTDTVEYVVKMSIDSNVTDNYSNNADGNYQGKNVNFSLKWWVENEND